MEYDIIHFEALGGEAAHIDAEMAAAVSRGSLPRDTRWLTLPDTLQDFLRAHPQAGLPGLITTKTHSVLPQDWLAGGRRSVVTRSAGYDHFQHLSAVANIASLREYCVSAVAQSALKLVHCAAGLLNQYTANTPAFDRDGAAPFMELGPHRTATVFGAGKIGRRICELLEGAGLTVQAVDIRQDKLSAEYGGRISFVDRDAARQSDIMICAMSLTRDSASRFFNAGYFSREYLASCRRGLIFVNVTRGEIAPESGLLELYRAGVLGGIGLDCYTDEAGLAGALRGGDAKSDDHAAAMELIGMALDRTGNVYVQPHQAYNSDLAVAAKARETVRHIEAWYRRGGSFDEQLPYYE